MRFVVAFLLSFIMLPCSADSFEYSNVVDPKHTIAIQTDPVFVSAGHLQSDARICEISEGFICVESEWFNFVVPLNISNQKKWIFKGYEYDVVSAGKATFFDIESEVFRIKSVQEMYKYTFLYSKKHGLMSFRGDFGSESAAFISTREIGFGAQ